MTKAWALLKLMPAIQEFVEEHIANTKIPGIRHPDPPSAEELEIISKYIKEPHPIVTDEAK